MSGPRGSGYRDPSFGLRFSGLLEDSLALERFTPVSGGGRSQLRKLHGVPAHFMADLGRQCQG